MENVFMLVSKYTMDSGKMIYGILTNTFNLRNLNIE